MAYFSNFDFKLLAHRIKAAYEMAGSWKEAERWLREEHDSVREDGIRVVLESRDRTSEDEMRARFGDAAQPEFAFDLTRLFPGSQEEERANTEFDLANFWLLRIPDIGYYDLDQNPFDLAHHLRERMDLRSAEPDIPLTANFPGGPTPPVQVLATKAIDRAWSLRNMRVPEAWAYSLASGVRSRGADVLVGHPDTGYTDHVDLDSSRLQVSLGYDFVDCKQDPTDPLGYRWSPGHGTATGSVLMSGGDVVPPPVQGEGGTSPPGKVTGVAPEASLVPIRTAKSVFFVFSSQLASAIHHARKNDCQVVSISMGGTPLRALRAAVDDAVARNLIVVAAAGNNVRIVMYPARFKNCIALAASNVNDVPWSGTSRGTAVDVSAPGEQVWRAWHCQPQQGNAEVGPSDGTSYATANAAGVAALWLAHHGATNLAGRAGTMRLQDLFRLELKTTVRTPQGWDTRNFGAGIIDALALLRFSWTAGTMPAPSPGTDSEREQAVDLLEPLASEDAAAVLANIFRAGEGGWARNMQGWDSEIISILFHLRLEGNLLFNEVLTNPHIFDGKRADQLSTLIASRASRALNQFMRR